MKLQLSVILSVVGLLVGCDRSSSPNNSSASPITVKSSQPSEAHHEGDGHDHDGDHHDDHDKGGANAGHGSAIIELGTTTTGVHTIRATRDEGAIKPAGDAPIDVWLTTTADEPAKVRAVRFWIGTEDAKSSIKAKAEIEDPKQPNHWHAHAEVPDPLPVDAKLWVEIEINIAEKRSASFPLKM